MYIWVYVFVCMYVWVYVCTQIIEHSYRSAWKAGRPWICPSKQAMHPIYMYVCMYVWVYSRTRITELQTDIHTYIHEYKHTYYLVCAPEFPKGLAYCCPDRVSVHSDIHTCIRAYIRASTHYLVRAPEFPKGLPNCRPDRVWVQHKCCKCDENSRHPYRYIVGIGSN